MSRSFVHRLRVEKKGFRRRRPNRRRFFFFFFFLSYFLCSKRRRRHRSIDQSVLLRMHAGPFAEVQVVENGHVPQVQGQRVVLVLVLVLVRIIDIIFLFWNTPPNAIFLVLTQSVLLLPVQCLSSSSSLSARPLREASRVWNDTSATARRRQRRRA